MKKTLKKLFVLALLIILIVAFAGIQFSKSPISSKFTITAATDSPQMFIAHRGLSSVEPENTLPAIEKAISSGFYGCEFDIHTTKDGIWILNHDTDIDKMTDGNGDIKDHTFEELQKFNIDNGNGIEHHKELKLPKLEDALSLFAQTTTVPFIEIKGYDPEAFKELLQIIENFNLSKKAVIISFDMEALLGIRELDSDIKLMYLTNNLTIEDVDICLKNGNIGVDINGGNIFKMKDAVSYAQQNGLETAAWTVDFPVHADLLNLFGIKYITTNRILP